MNEGVNEFTHRHQVVVVISLPLPVCVQPWSSVLMLSALPLKLHALLVFHSLSLNANLQDISQETF